MNIEKILSPHCSSRDGYNIEGIVIHYTGGGSALGTVKWFRNKHSRVSAHFTIGRKGQTYQSVSLDKTAWHAGQSKFLNQGKVNQRTIGIELTNRGYLIESDEKFYYERGGDLREYKGLTQRYLVPTSDDRMYIETYWEPYPVHQLETLTQLLEYLKYEKNLPKEVFQNIVGHDEICIPSGKKSDPGPLFPWNLFRWERGKNDLARLKRNKP